MMAGCGGPAIVGPPGVEIGTGSDHFVALADGDTVPIIHGIQGGYHVWGAVRARGVDPSGLRLRFTVWLTDGTDPVTTRTDRVDLDGSGVHAGTAVFLPDPTVVRDHDCRLRVDITDVDGRTAGDERVVRPE
jgi:hypothetical protein